MVKMMKNCRRILAGLATALLLVAVLWSAVRNPADEPKQAKNAIAFFLIGDTHILADKKDAGKLDDRSASYNAALADVLNKLPGSEIPKSAGGGTVAKPR